MTLNRTVSAGVPSDQFYVQLQVKNISMTEHAPFSFKVAVFSGLQSLDCTQETYRWNGEEMTLHNCVLNFFIPHKHSNRKSNYSIGLLRVEDMEPAATIELDTKPLISDFIFQNATSFSRKLAFGLGCSLTTTIFINKTRVLLLKTVKHYEEMQAQDTDQTAQAKGYHVESQPHLTPYSKQPEKTSPSHVKRQLIEQIVESIDGEQKTVKTTTIKSNMTLATGGIRARVSNLQKVQTQHVHPKWSTEGNLDSNGKLSEFDLVSQQKIHKEDYQEIQSPLIKLLNSKSNHHTQKQKSNNKLKHTTSEFIRIKRTDSIDEQEQVNKKRYVKMTLVAVLLIVITFYLFLKISQSIMNGDEKDKTKQPTKPNRKNKHNNEKVEKVKHSKNRKHKQ